MKCSFVLIAFPTNENKPFIRKLVRKKKGGGGRTILSITVFKMELTAYIIVKTGNSNDQVWDSSDQLRYVSTCEFKGL